MDSETRIWQLDDAALDAIHNDNDLQSILSCTKEGDVVLFNFTRTIRPIRRVVIPWNLTLSSKSENVDSKTVCFRRRPSEPSSHVQITMKEFSSFGDMSI